jgi:hypothetical protein
MALPETKYEQMNKEAREKERLDRQKMLVSLPRGKTLEDYLAAAASRNVDLREAVEDLLLTVRGLDDGETKTKLLQETRLVLDHATKVHKMSVVASRDGVDLAQKVFNPAPKDMDMEDEESKLLDKLRKEKETAKRKEAAEADKGGWKGLSSKRATPYNYNYGTKMGYNSYGYGGGAGNNLGNWALQQLLAQQLSGQGAAKGGGSTAPAAAGSASTSQPQQEGAYAARIAMARIQYPCHGCGLMGHWKKDGSCKPADVASYIKKKMAAQAKKDQEEDEEAEQGT